MRHRHDPSLSYPVPIFVRRPDAASDLPSLSALERRAYRHAPVTGFEWAMLLAGLAWVITVTFVRWPAPLYPQFGSNSTIDAAFFALAGRLVRDGQVPCWTISPALRAFYDYVAASYAAVDVVGPQRWVIYARRPGPEMR